MNLRSSLFAALIGLMLPAAALAQCVGWKAGPLDVSASDVGANGNVYASTYYGSDLIVGGAFTTIGGISANHVAALNTVTGQWTALGPGVGCDVLAMTVWNGKLVIGGNGDNDPADTDNNIQAWDGTSWTGFYGGTSTGSVTTLAVYNGELYAGGNFVIYPTVLDIATNVAHWNVSAGHWENMGGPGTDPGQTVNGLYAWSGKMYAGTYYHDIHGNPQGDVWSFDGTNWTSLVTCNSAVECFQAWNGGLAIGGYFNVVGTSSLASLMWLSGGTFYGMGWTSGVVQTLGAYNGNLAAGGSFTNAGGTAATNVSVLESGTWTALSSGVNGTAQTLLQDGSDLFVGGLFTTAGGESAPHLARWSGNSWAPGSGGSVGGVLAMTQYSGRLVIAGSFDQADDPYTAAHDIVGWDGSQLFSYGTGMDNQINALKSYSFGFGINQTLELVAGGYFTHAGGTAVNHIAKWDRSSLIITNPAWTAMGNGFDGAVLAIERATVASATNTYAAGNFTHSGATGMNYVSRWNATSGAWEALGTGMNGPVYALRAYGGYLYAGGGFTTAGGIATGGLARWDGTSWSQVGGDFNGTVLALELYNGSLVIGGIFPGINSSPNLAYYNGSVYGTFSTGGANGSVLSLHAVGTRLYVGGAFTTAGGVSASHLAYWDGSWHDMGGGADNNAYALGDWGGEVLAGGAFSVVGGGSPVLSPHCARFTTNGLDWYVSQPYSQQVVRGATLTLNGKPATGYGASEQWYLNGTALVDGAHSDGSTVTGSQGPALTITAIAAAELGNYQAVLTDGCGPDSSTVATITYDGTTGVQPGVYATAFDAVGPNPNRGEARLAFSLAHDARVAVHVLDLAGRRVGSADLGTLGAGAHSAAWSARASNGDALRPGLYFVSLEVDGVALPARRVTLVR